MALTDEQIAQERKAFEAARPMPENCMWCGRGYAGTEYNAWGAHEYAAIFKGWIERAAAIAPLLERIAALEANLAYANEVIEQRNTMLSAAYKEAQVEKAAQPVMMQFRWTNPGDNPSPSEYEMSWQEVTTSNRLQSLQDRIGELLSYKYNGKPCYEIRALYTSPPKAAPLTEAATDVLAERQRQISAEGWTPEHDDEHKEGSLARAGGLYALNSGTAMLFGTDDTSICETPPNAWPWKPERWKPKNARRDLVKAGALILAEIERIDRAHGITPATVEKG